MNKFAWLFFCLVALTGVMGFSADSQDGQTIAFVACGVFASLLVLTLIAGRRIKFDPVLR